MPLVKICISFCFGILLKDLLRWNPHNLNVLFFLLCLLMVGSYFVRNLKTNCSILIYLCFITSGLLSALLVLPQHKSLSYIHYQLESNADFLYFVKGKSTSTRGVKLELEINFIIDDNQGCLN